MKAILKAIALLAALLAVPMQATAASLAADVPDASCDKVRYAGLPLPALVVPVLPGKLASGADGRISKLDLVALPPGDYTATAYCQNSALGLESVPSAPFAFTKPASVGAADKPTIVSVGGVLYVQAAVGDQHCTEVLFSGAGGSRTAPVAVVGGNRLARSDLTGLGNGSYSVSATCRSALWGIAAVASAPFDFAWPATPGAPATLHLAP